MIKRFNENEEQIPEINQQLRSNDLDKKTRTKEKLSKKNWKRNILKKSKCHCGAEEGELHGVCDLWLCPTCGGQLGMCDCDSDGKEPVPFIDFPTICDYCGELWPELFMDDEWNDLLPEIYWDKVLCLDCWEYIKGLLASEQVK